MVLLSFLCLFTRTRIGYPLRAGRKDEQGTLSHVKALKFMLLLLSVTALLEILSFFP